ncbi:unnamed protein product [Paramecium sonneborni]|uniref:Uncharacterized protein n=1 Tax=Paramecium sonneborni TaxID=65129 RepID=A0A8S1NWH8_9CILI|nr:unnamed protein product [Paramecium sonneborni]CAD8114723.1 unnamed protein product [Paramecium sonneborni]
MKRLLRNAQILQKQSRYYHHDPASRALVGSPQEIAPPIHFKLYYLPDNVAKTAQGMGHPHYSPYQMEGITNYDNWEYKYYGQWWHIGSVFWNSLMLFYPLLLWFVIEQSEQEALLAKDDMFKKYFNEAGGFYQFTYISPETTINY